MRSYTNVAASQPPDAFLDASMFLWTEDTSLDSLRAVGFKSRWTGQTYCVAPIVDAVMSNVDPVSYWAVGENCCNARGSFWCGDTNNPTTRSSLVVLEPEDVVRPFMTWATLGSAYARYERAIRLQQATFATKASPNIRLVVWSKEPIAAKDAFYNDAALRCTWISLLFFLGLECAACWVTAKFILVPRASGQEAVSGNSDRPAQPHAATPGVPSMPLTATPASPLMPANPGAPLMPRTG